MQLIDKNKYGLVAYGTKEGRVIFFSINVAKDSFTNNSFDDIRESIQFSYANDAEFYSVELRKECACFTIYHTIIDSVKRPGYFAISVLLSPDRTFFSNSIQPLLKKLANKYVENYICPPSSTTPYQVRSDIGEDKSIFEEVLKEQANDLLLSEKLYEISSASQVVIVRYKTEIELSDFFEGYTRRDFLQNKRIIFLPEDNNNFRLAKDFAEIKLQLPPVTVKLSFSVRDSDSKDILRDVVVAVFKNGQKLNHIGREQKAVFEIKATIEDTFSIIISKDGYETYLVGEFESKRYIQDALSELPLDVYMKKIQPPTPLTPGYTYTPQQDTTTSGTGTAFDAGMVLDMARKKIEKDAQLEKEKKQKKHTWLLWFIIILLIIVIAAMLIQYFVLSPKPQNATVSLTEQLDSLTKNYESKTISYKETLEGLESIKKQENRDRPNDSLNTNTQIRQTQDRIKNSYMQTMADSNAQKIRDSVARGAEEKRKKDSVARVAAAEKKKREEDEKKSEKEEREKITKEKKSTGGAQLTAAEKNTIAEAGRVGPRTSKKEKDRLQDEIEKIIKDHATDASEEQQKKWMVIFEKISKNQINKL